MPERSATITIRCGEETCAASPGAFCRFFGTRHFGQQPVCWFPFDATKFTPADLAESSGDRLALRSIACKETFKP